MNDRRRINGPTSGTQTVVFANKTSPLKLPQRTRKSNELRKIFLQTGLVSAASGSAYLELEVPPKNRTLIASTSTLKLCCAIHGPKPLDRNSNFSPNLQLTASIKFAPFATRQRRGYVRDNIERDLGSHLENALKGAIIPDRWPKSAIDVTVTVLEGEEDSLWAAEGRAEKGITGVGLMNVLAGSITVASAALANAKIDCLDMVVGGVAARITEDSEELLDPCPSEHEEIWSACVIGYLPSRDEVTEVWLKNSAGNGGMASLDGLIDAAVKAARGAQKVLAEALLESIQQASKQDSLTSRDTTHDIEMKT